jgi:predicted dehydrogenase
LAINEFAEIPDKLRVAVAGTSFGGNVQIPVFQTHPRTQVVAVSSGRAQRAEQTAREHGIGAHYSDFEEMLDKEKPDLVSIVTPPDQHFHMSMAALRRRIHVLCEKPFALNLREAREMQAAAKQAGVVAMIDFEFRFVPARAYAMELLKQRYVGEVRMADFGLHIGSRPQSEDAGWTWWSDASRGGGVLGAYGSHISDMLRLMVGEPRRVFCDLVTFVRERPGGIVTSDDGYTLLIEFQSGARAVVQMTVAAGVNDVRLGVFGTEGQLIMPDIYGNHLLGGKREGRTSGPIEIPEEYCLPREDHPLRAPFRVLLTRMVHAIDNHLPSPAPNFDDAVASQAILDAARLSARQGLWVEI